ncbi:MAG: hypothetical protein QM692_21385 [Thermomicrobiales bacterium]
MTLSPTAPFRVSRRAVARSLSLGLTLAGSAGLLAALSAGRAAAWAQAATPDAADDAYPDVEIVGKDFAFELPAEIAGGLTRFRLINEGTFTHHVIFLRLHDGVTQEQIDAAAQEPDYLPLLALGEPMGGPNAAPVGGSATAIVDLPEGAYQVFCVIGDDQEIPHYRHGMIAPLTVTAAPANQPKPMAERTIVLSDYAFHDLPAELPAGEHVWEITNAGPEIHELVVFRQAPGVTFDMIAGIFGAAPEGTPVAVASPPPGPPFMDVGGVTLMAPGVTNWAILDLEAGDYFAICFVLSPDHDKAPHFAFGMIQPLTIV